MSQLLCSLILLCAFATGPLLAQQSAAMKGPRIRVRRAGVKDWISGTLKRTTADSLILATADGAVAMGRTDATSVEMSWGKKRNTLKGALYGGAILGAIGVGLGSYVAATDETEDGDLGIAEGASIAGGVGAVVGGLIGAGVGTFIQTEHWQAVEVESLQLSLSASPEHGSMRIGLSASF